MWRRIHSAILSLLLSSPVFGQQADIELVVTHKFPDSSVEEDYYLSRPLDITLLDQGQIAVSDQLAASAASQKFCP